MRKHGDLNEETSTPPADPVRPTAIDVEALLRRIQLRYETLGPGRSERRQPSTPEGRQEDPELRRETLSYALGVTHPLLSR